MPEPAPSTTSPAPQTYFFLNPLRAFAIFLVVLFHSWVPYVRFLRGLLWAIKDDYVSPWADWISQYTFFLGIPMFFLIAGFVAEFAWRRQGMKQFAVGRARHLLVPSLIVTAAILPIIYVIWGFGLYTSGRVTVLQLWKMQFDPRLVTKSDLLGLGHLWYLWYLCTMTVAYAAARPLVARAPLSRLVARLAQARGLLVGAGVLLLVPLPTCALLCWKPDIVTEHHNRFYPELPRLLHFGYLFVVGAMLYPLLSTVAGALRAWPVLFLAAGVGAWACYAPLRVLVLDASARLAPLSLLRFGLAAAATIWFWLLGLWGLAQRHFNRPIAPVDRVAGSVFWIYVIHLPLLALLQIGWVWVERWGPWVFHPAVKAMSAFVATGWICLATDRWIQHVPLLRRVMPGGRDKAKIFDRVRTALVAALDVDEDEIVPQAKVLADLGADSVDSVDIMFRLHRDFGVDISRDELIPDRVLLDPRFVRDGKLTDAGVAELKRRMTYTDLSELGKNPSIDAVADLLTVQALVDYVVNKLDRTQGPEQGDRAL